MLSSSPKISKGNVEIRQPLEVGPGKGAAFGAVTGAIVGLLGGPGGAFVGLVSGAVTGGAAGAIMASGLPQADIKKMAVDELRRGEAALMVYIDEAWIDQIEQAATDVAADIAHHIVKEERKIAREKAAAVRKERIDGAFKSWQAKLDNLRASVTALRQKAVSGLQSDRAAIQSQIDSANAKLNATYKNVLQTLRAWQKQVDDNINEFEANVKDANAEAKADTESRLAAAKEARQALRTHVKETLSATLNDLKSRIENVKAQAAKAQGQAKEELNQRVAKLEANWAAEQKRMEALDSAYGAAWDQMVKGMEEALDTFEDSVREAETETKHE